MNDKLLIRVAGDNRIVNIEVLLKHIANSLRGIDLSAGDHYIETGEDGSIWLDGMKVFTPPRPQVARKGA